MDLAAAQGCRVSYQDLCQVVTALRYKDGWEFWLSQGCTSGSPVPPSQRQATGALTSSSAFPFLLEPVFLHVSVLALDSTDPEGERTARFVHTFAAPPPELVPEWDRWLLDRIMDVERHEAMEFFTVAGRKPFNPGHGPEGRLYEIVRST